MDDQTRDEIVSLALRCERFLRLVEQTRRNQHLEHATLLQRAAERDAIEAFALARIA